MLAIIAWFAGASRQGWQRVLGIARARAVSWAALAQAAMLGLLAGAILSSGNFFWFLIHKYDSPAVWWYGYLLGFALTGAFFEEILFRNLLLGALMRNMPFAAANAAHALLFSIWHVYMNGLSFHTNLWFVGCLFGAVWHRAGLLAALITHLVGNYTSMVIGWNCGSLAFGW